MDAGASANCGRSFHDESPGVRGKLSNLYAMRLLELMSVQLLNMMAQVCRDSSKPMGGLQVVFTGDFFQLPPVESNDSRSHMRTQQDVRGGTKIPFTSASSRFCFQTAIWFQLFDRAHSFVLQKVFRQEDPSFVALLDAIRWGATSGTTSIHHN
jgi:ATP-dependent DNA helicase PIF1